jgi:hypothetical protein
MKTVMDFKVSTTCPIDGETIPVSVTVEPFHFIEVEDLLKIANAIASKPVTQESFTQQLIGSFKFKSLVTVGIHSGVRITCSA